MNPTLAEFLLCAVFLAFVLALRGFLAARWFGKYKPPVNKQRGMSVITLLLVLAILMTLAITLFFAGSFWLTLEITKEFFRVFSELK